MSSRGLHPAHSSRDESPEAHANRYDPFRDPIELSHLPQPTSDVSDSYGSRVRSPGQSPDDISPGRSRPDSYFGASKSGGQYAPLPGLSETPQPSDRSVQESAYTLTSLYHSKTVDADTQALMDRRAGEIAQWHIHWKTPALIASLFVAGILAAIGHHLFYTSLDGRAATEQLKMVRYGTALAFFVKSTLVGTVITCNRQRIWRTFRTKAMTIKGIDGLFSAAEDPTQFFLNWEMVKNGKLATFMAASSWLIPIASVLSPAALTSQMSLELNTTTCLGVANLNFTRESVYNFRNENDTDGRGKSMQYYNTTDPTGKPGYFDYYDQPSKNAHRLAFSTAYLMKPQTRDNAQLEFCGDGWNCTYSINFVGPGYKCEDIGSSDMDEAPFNLTQLAPEGNFTYLAQVDQDDYQDPQIDSRANGVPIQDPPYPDSLGVFESEPILWIGYANRTTELYPDDSPYATKWQYVHESMIFKCVMHYTNYTFEMQYTPAQSATRTQRDFLSPVVDTQLEPKLSNSSDWVAIPSSNFVRPGDDPETYKLTAAFHSLGQLLRMFLSGDIEKDSDTLIVTRSDISQTRLINEDTSYPVPNLMEGIQSVLEDFLVTLLSDPTLVIAEPQDVTCQKSRTILVYRYFKHSLWIGYAAVISLTLAFVLVGAWSIHQNGVASDVLFSRMLVTTRNPTLDHLSVGACLGGDPFPKELVKTKLRFGVLLEDDPREGPLGKVEHCAFGTVGETKEIVKGGTYAGLKKWMKFNEENASVQKEKLQ